MIPLLAFLVASTAPALAQDPAQQMLALYEQHNQPHPEVYDTGFRVDPGRLMAHVEVLEHMPRFTAEGRSNAAAYIAGELQKTGWNVEYQEVRVEGAVVGQNVVASYAGSEPQLGSVLLGAHYDSFANSPGGDDNASGVAAILEIARVSAASGLTARRTVHLVLFDLEETMGQFFGSNAFRASPAGQGVEAVIVLEGIGRTCASAGCQQFPGGLPTPRPDTGDFLSVVVDTEHTSLVEAFRITAQPDLPLYILSVPMKGRAAPSVRRSDHSVFWDANVGAIMLTDTSELRGDQYHTMTDTSSNMDRAFLQKTTKAAFDALFVMANAPTL